MLPVLKKLQNRKIKKLKEEAKAFEQQKDWAKAKAVWSAISHTDPAYQFAYIKLGNIYNELGDHHQAISQFQKIADTDPRYVYDKHVGIAGVYERLDDWQASLNAWEQAIEAVPPKPENTKKVALALSHKAKCLLKLNKPGESNIFITAALYLDHALRGDTDATLTRMALAKDDPVKLRFIAERARRLGNQAEIIERTRMRLS